ncbi:transcriptional regulator [Candidatus Nitromaritima sp. SCGC AAA799-C22]|nr:transcriptional regulator [Candidatus Nitromaritima sp. SCGC AAA799-C22]
MDPVKLKDLLTDLESDRAERTSSISNKDKICKAICAFSNDLPNNGKPGYFFVGVDDNGTISNQSITDQLLLKLSGIRSEGNILPIPMLNVQKHVFDNMDVAVIEVIPSDSPPVRFKGVCWIRVGPSARIATQEEEKRLAEKRISGTLTFDKRPFNGATLEDLDMSIFKIDYLPSAVERSILSENQRTDIDQLSSLRFWSPKESVPTAAGLMVVGKDPQFWLPGAYIQFVRVDGSELVDPIKDQKEIRGTLMHQIRMLDEVMEVNISTPTKIAEKGSEVRSPDYPIPALQQLVRNALMHRDYEGSNAPVRIYWYSDRVEITNPGGLYGQVTSDNFGDITDYRNPQIAESMKTLGFVQRFGMGVQIVRNELQKNGNPPPEFKFEPSYFHVTVFPKK